LHAGYATPYQADSLRKPNSHPKSLIKNPNNMNKLPIIITIFLAILSQSLTAQNDARGCEDHPLITRYPGSVLTWCQEQNFAEYKIAVGPQTGYKNIDKWVDTEGKIYRQYYELQQDRTLTEVYRNYLNAIQKAGFEVLARGIFEERNVKKEVGGGTWLGTAYAPNSYPVNAGIKLHQGSSDAAGTCYIAAKLKRATGNVYVVIGGHTYSNDYFVFMIDVIEESAMDDGLVSLDADAMGRDIDQYGKVAIYGIFFDFDKATLKAESKPALEEISKLMKARPNLNLYVVGHTDSKGNLTYNLTLAEKRAKAVVEALVGQYGISRARLEGHGVGPLVPVFTNRQDAGRAKNRRVELVEKL
jgi:OOP family OmpA-OmpF porin